MFFAGFSLATTAIAEDYYHADLLRIGGEMQQIDERIAILANNDFLPGSYEVNLYINRKLAMVRSFDFILQEEKIVPCLNVEEFSDLGIDLSGVETFESEGRSCVDITKSEYVDFSVNWEDRSLSLSIPQIYVDEQRLLKAQEKLWDNGINHFSMNYAFSSYAAQGSATNQYLNIRPSVNVGAWRLQNYSVWMRGEQGSRWNSISTTASRSLVSLHSELSLGENYSSPMLFDAVKLRGVTLKSSDQMRPNNDRSYVPAITGIANSDAQLTVEQSGNVIYQANVPAGPYSITDYYPASMGGDLTVHLREADGSVKTTVHPYTALPIMEKKGRFKYSFSSGSMQEDVGQEGSQYVNQLEMVYGLTQHQTVYGGLQVSQNYKALALGVGSNFGSWGALATDLTHARHRQWDGRTESGKALRLNYAKGFATQTSLSAMYSRSLDRGFVQLRDAMVPRDSLGREKALLNVALSQPLPGSMGSISMNMSRYEYHTGQHMTSYNMGYSGSRNGISYSVYLNKYRNNERLGNAWGRSHAGSEISVTVSIPLSRLSSSTWVNFAASRNQNNDVDTSARLSGTALDNQLDWGVYQGYGNHDTDAYGGLNAAYNSSVGNFNAGYSYAGSQRRNYSYGMTGAVTVTPYGAVLSRSLHESNALVVAPGAANVRVRNQIGVETNSRGLAVVPGLSSFRSNTITLETDSIPDDVDIEGNIVSNLYPTKGALILSRFETRIGYKALFVVGNQEVPTGAKASITGTDVVSVASGFNQIYMVAPAKQGRIELSWMQDGEAQGCTIDFDLQQANLAGGLHVVNTECRP